MKSNAQTNQTDQRASEAFTLTELLIVIGAVVILLLTVLPALARSQPNAKSALCQNNLKQLTSAWQMYPEEFRGRLVLNYHGGDAMGGSRAGWVTGWLDWSLSSDNTNTLFLTNARYALLSPYLHGANVFKCPADQHVSALQRARGWTQRARSYSANIFVGDGNATVGPSNPLYKQIKKSSEFRYPTPSEAALYLDEHPDSINDPGFFPPNQTAWVDVPATYHAGAAAVSFADGHVEAHKWRASLATGVPASVGDPDISWMSYRTPRVSSESY